MPGRYCTAMGFNPHRRRVARRSDLLFVAAAVLLAAALLAWAFLG